MGAFERAQLIDEAGELVSVEDQRAVGGVKVQAAAEVELDLAGERVGIPAGVEVGELVALDVELELKVAGCELQLDHARALERRRWSVGGDVSRDVSRPAAAGCAAACSVSWKRSLPRVPASRIDRSATLHASVAVMRGWPRKLP